MDNYDLTKIKNALNYVNENGIGFFKYVLNRDINHDSYSFLEARLNLNIPFQKIMLGDNLSANQLIIIIYNRLNNKSDKAIAEMFLKRFKDYEKLKLLVDLSK